MREQLMSFDFKIDGVMYWFIIDMRELLLCSVNDERSDERYYRAIKRILSYYMDYREEKYLYVERPVSNERADYVHIYGFRDDQLRKTICQIKRQLRKLQRATSNKAAT
ncbi:MAG: hypothetical protein IJ867_06885 [Clostridia bacterium]|nr:hypothetical protein [Clostridia bacterium]